MLATSTHGTALERLTQSNFDTRAARCQIQIQRHGFQYPRLVLSHSGEGCNMHYASTPDTRVSGSEQPASATFCLVRHALQTPNSHPYFRFVHSRVRHDRLSATVPPHHTLRRLAEGKQTYGTYLSPCFEGLLGTAVKIPDGSNAALPWHPWRLILLDRLATRKCNSQQACEKSWHLYDSTSLRHWVYPKSNERNSTMRTTEI